MKTISIMVIIFSLLPFVWGSSVFAEEGNSINIASESAILIDAKSGIILYEKESRKQMYPASITKLVTAIVALEAGNLEDMVVVSENARNVEGTRVYLDEGEVVSLQKLLQGLLINSGNDAGIAIAEHIDGTVAGFSERMNTFVKEKVGVTDSSFVNPHGLFHKNHYTTAYDMAQITRYAINNKVFTKMISTESLPWKGQSWETVLYNHHKLLREIPYKGVIGGKNGYVQKSGYTLVTAAQRGDIRLIAVTLNADRKNQPYQDTIALFNYGFEHFNPNLILDVKKSETSKIKDELPAKIDKHIITTKMEIAADDKIESPWIRDVQNTDVKEMKNHSTPVSVNLFIILSFIEFFLIVVILRLRKNNDFYYK
jgi:D-alanyl-D-alanine carboxypeptidase (penicillin-binding protein 5/6)